MITLGYVPADLTVSLSVDTDFVATLVSTPPWADGAELSLEFLSGGVVIATWSAEIVEGEATWNVAAADVATLINSTSRTARLMETTDGTSVVRAKGTVRIT